MVTIIFILTIFLNIIPVVFSYFAFKRNWFFTKYIPFKNLNKVQLEIDSQEITISKKMASFSEVYNYNSLGDKIIVKKLIYEMADEFVSDIKNIWAQYLAINVAIFICISVYVGSKLEPNNNAIDFFNGFKEISLIFINLLSSSIGILIINIKRICDFFYIKKIMEKPKYADIINGKERNI